MAQNTFGCVSIESCEIATSNEYPTSDTRPVNQTESDSYYKNTNVYQFQAPKQAEIFLSKNAKLCQISTVNTNESTNPWKSEESTCHSVSVGFDNGNSVDSESRIMGANHSYSLRNRQEMKKNGEGKFSSTDELCIQSEMSDNVPEQEVHTLSKREKAPIPPAPGTKENGQIYSFGYSEAKCNTTPRNRVRLGEYIEPADATNFTWGHKSRRTTEPSQEYSEPYESRKICNNLKQSPSWKRRLHPSGGVVYELAQTPEVIYDQPPSQQEEEEDDQDYNKLHRNGSQSKGKIKLPDNYDHVPPKLNNKNVFDDYDPVPSTGCDLKQLVIDQESATYSLASEIKPIMPIKNGRAENPSIYEEPWDSKSKQLELQSKIQRAHSQTEDRSKIVTQLSSPTSSSSSSSFGDKHGSPEINTKIKIRSPSNSSTNTYEDAWDSPIRQQQLQEQLRKVQCVSNSSSSSNTYEDAWDTQERLSQFEQKIQRAMSHEGNTKPKPVGTETYSEPWDTPARQKELQERLQANIRAQRKQSGGSLSAHSTSSQLSIGSCGSPSSPTRRNIYPDSRLDDSQDLRLRGQSSSSTKSNQSLSLSSGGSPTHRGRQSAFCTIGERINPCIPVECQSWYHGNISRNDAEKMLRVCKEGSYLVRDSESDRGQKSLSLKSSRMNIHVKITHKINGTYVLGENSRDFNSIPEMVDYYTCHLLPLKGAEHITLLHPVHSKWADQ